jgi:hypothetical protein
MKNLFAACMLAPYELDRQGVNVLILIILASIAEAVGVDEEELLNKAQEVYDKL